MKHNTRKAVIKRAYEINKMLDNLKEKINELTEEMQDVEDNEEYDDFSLRALRQTLEDLICFDLEDAIINAED